MIFVVPISGTLAILWILWVFVLPKFGYGSAGFGLFLLVVFLLALFSCFAIVDGANDLARDKLERAAKKRAAKAKAEAEKAEQDLLFFDARES